MKKQRFYYGIVKELYGDGNNCKQYMDYKINIFHEKLKTVIESFQ